MMMLPMTEVLLRHLFEVERDGVAREVVNFDVFANLALRAPCAHALVEGGEVLVGFGLIPHWHGRAEAWQLTSRNARPRQLVRAARLAVEVMDAYQQDPAYRRVEMYVQAQCPWALSFIKALGFKARIELAQWDPLGRNFWFCERLRGAA